MAIDLSAFERTVKAHSSTWEALGVAYVVHPVSPNHGKPVVWADFEGAGHLATVISWVSGETELESARVADGRIVNRHYELGSSSDLEVVLDDFARLLRDGTIPKGSVVTWHNDQPGPSL
jgi:hypothetical protein